MRSRLHISGLLALTLASACAPQLGTQVRSRPFNALVTHNELRATNASSLYDAIRRTRPLWLMGRGGGVQRHFPVVYINNVRFGGLARLHDLEVYDVTSVRFVSALDATTRWGATVPGGVLEISTRR